MSDTPSRAIAAIDKAFKEQTGVVGEVKELTEAINQLERDLAAAKAALVAMTQSRDEWKHRYGQMDNERIVANARAEQNEKDAEGLRGLVVTVRALVRGAVPYREIDAEIQSGIDAAIAAKEKPCCT